MKKRKKILLISSIAIALLINSACASTKVQEKIDEREKEKEKVEKVAEEMKDVPPDKVKLTKEQMEILKKMETKDVYEAISDNELEKRKEVKINVPTERKVFTDPSEFSQYIAFLFYKYNTKQMESDDFYEKISPHFDEDFEQLLPSNEEYQKEAFKLLQDEFIAQLPAEIVGYKITELNIDERTKESTFYRLYELKNGQRIYYMTVIRPTTDGQWLLVNDKLAPPYETSKAKEKFEQETGEKH